MPAAVAWVVTVAMTSSASNPSTIIDGMRSASRTSRISVTWPRKSSGVSLRPAL